MTNSLLIGSNNQFRNYEFDFFDQFEQVLQVRFVCLLLFLSLKTILLVNKCLEFQDS